MIKSASTKHGPLVTVLMSTYNRPQYLREALDSVFRQTWCNFEVLLVRDGGLKVREAIAEFLDDPRLTFIDREQNRGKPYSYNEALTQARGEFVCYLDDDDKFYPFHIETLANALLSQDRCRAAYSDLYKTHCRVMPDGRRIVLAKNVEISRDFNRMLMLQFNHALHVSLMHRRDLFDRTGLYNDKLNVMIDWDMTRRLCFFTDFLHVPIVTGEFYAPVGQCDRISVQRRKNVSEYLCNVMTIRSSRPAKPWPCMHDLSVIVLGQDGPSQAQAVRELWAHSFYPCEYYVPMTPQERAQFSSGVPNVVVVPVEPNASYERRLDIALTACGGDFAAVVPTGIAIPSDEAGFLERSLNPLLEQPALRNTAFEVVESTPTHWAAVFRKEELAAARQAHPRMPLAASVQAAGIEVRRSRFADFPFQFDSFVAIAFEKEREGDWAGAAQIYELAGRQFGNTRWMQTLRANALYHQSRWEAAAALAEQLNRTHPTVARLMIEARARQKLNDFSAAAALYRRAETILDGNITEYPQDRPDAADDGTDPTMPVAAEPKESMVWTA